MFGCSVANLVAF